MSLQELCYPKKKSFKNKSSKKKKKKRAKQSKMHEEIKVQKEIQEGSSLIPKGLERTRKVKAREQMNRKQNMERLEQLNIEQHLSIPVPSILTRKQTEKEEFEEYKNELRELSKMRRIKTRIEKAKRNKSTSMKIVKKQKKNMEARKRPPSKSKHMKVHIGAFDDDKNDLNRTKPLFMAQRVEETCSPLQNSAGMLKQKTTFVESNIETTQEDKLILYEKSQIDIEMPGVLSNPDEEPSQDMKDRLYPVLKQGSRQDEEEELDQEIESSHKF